MLFSLFSALLLFSVFSALGNPFKLGSVCICIPANESKESERPRAVKSLLQFPEEAGCPRGRLLSTTELL